MDRIAVISDVHGNLPALKSVLADIEAKGIDNIICLGDIIGKGPSMKETIDMCRKSCEIVIKGNWEDYLFTHPENKKYTWFRNEIGPERMQYLGALPFATDFYLSGKLVRLFHAHPQNLYKRIFPGNSYKDKLEMFGCPKDPSGIKYAQEADIAGYGDIHSTYIENFDNKVLFNVGSVGNPLDIPLASYAILEGIYGSRFENPYSIQFCRVPYDKELAIAMAKAVNMPEAEAYINEITTAQYSR